MGRRPGDTAMAAARRVDRALGSAEDRILRALALGPCDYATLVARVTEERAERMRDAGVADAAPKIVSRGITSALQCADVVARYTGVRCPGPRGFDTRYLCYCTFELSPYGAYVADNPELFKKNNTMFAFLIHYSHRAYARVRTELDRGAPPADYDLDDVESGRAIYADVAARAAASGVVPPPRPYFL